MKIEHINEESIHPSRIIVAGGEKYLDLHFQKPGMTISLNRHEKEQLDNTITFAVKKILSHSRYAINYGKALRRSIAALKHRFEKLGFIDEKGVMRELTPVELESYADDAFKELATDWLYGVSGWGKDTRDFIKKAMGEDTLSLNNDAWLIDNSNFELISDDAKIDSMFRITNADTLVGLVKPQYMHNGDVDISVRDWSLKIALKGDDAAMLMNYFAADKEPELKVAKIFWDRLGLINTAIKRFKDSFKENGLEDDCFIICEDEINPVRLSKEFTALFNAIESPDAMQAFCDEFADKEKPTNNSVSTTFS